MREAAREIVADLPEAIMAAAGVAAFITFLTVVAALGAGA